MSDAVPVSLLIARRALCPGCGAPLTLEADAVAVSCGYCGCESGVERRLRTVEAELVAGTDPAEINRGSFVPAHLMAGEGHAELGCPGCGSPIDIQRAQDVTECPHCGSCSKVERQLNPKAANPCNDALHDAELAEFAKTDPSVAKEAILEEYRRTGEFDPYALADRYCDLALMVVLTAHKDEVILKNAGEIKAWKTLTHWRECMLSRLMLKADQSKGKVGDALIERVGWVARLAEVWDEKRRAQLRALVRASARAFYRADVSERLLFAVGSSQRSATLKLVLDVAEWALANGHGQAADNALTAAARMLDKRLKIGAPVSDQVDAERLAEVMLYRLLYLRPELLAWALEQIPRWQLNDYRKLARFIDDCAYERPELIGVIRDAWIVKQKPARTFKEYAEHLEFLDTLLTPAAREYAMYLYCYMGYAKSPDPNPELLLGILKRLGAMLDDAGLRKQAAWQLSQFVRRVGHDNLPCVPEFMREHGDRLPAYVWWSFRKGDPTAELPERANGAMPSEQEPTHDTPLSRELAKFRSRHDREHELRAQEQRREASESNAAHARVAAGEYLKEIRRELDWRPDPRAEKFYRALLSDMRVAGEGGDVHRSSPFISEMKHKLDMALLEYDDCHDPRYKDYIEALEAAYDTRLELGRLREARKQASEFAGKSWLGRLLHKKRRPA